MSWRRSTGVEAPHVRPPAPFVLSEVEAPSLGAHPSTSLRANGGGRRTGQNEPIATDYPRGFFPASDDSTPRIVRISWLDQPGLVSSVRSVRRVVWILSGG
jgi:hypothetical protein